MKFLIWIKDFFAHLIRRILQIFFTTTIALVCLIIYFVTYEPGKGTAVTLRKCRRIRKLTKLKLYSYKYFSWLHNFLHDDYMRGLYNRFHFLIDK